MTDEALRAAIEMVAIARQTLFFIGKTPTCVSTLVVKYPVFPVTRRIDYEKDAQVVCGWILRDESLR